MRWSSSLVLLAVLPVQLCSQDTGAVRAAASTITPADIHQRISVLAHDSLKGRSTARPEIEKAANYIAGEFRKFALKAGGDQETFLGRYSIVRGRIEVDASRIAAGDGPTWRFGRDFLTTGRDLVDIETTGPALVVTGVPDTAAIPGLGVSRAIVIFAPSTASLASPAQMNAILAALRAAGPAAILVPLGAPDSIWNLLAARQRQMLTRRSWDATGAPLLMMREQVISQLLAPHGIDLATARGAGHPLRATALPMPITVTLRAAFVTRMAAPNVIGILEGSDPALKNEYVVFSAHMDHLGVGPPDASGDSIANGADDDASGTAAVIELAEAFAALPTPPKRSLIFLTVSGEEMGLYGSDAFAARPPVPIGQIVADLNIDMVGRNWRDTIVAIGKEHSDLGPTLHRVSAAHPELRMAPIDDPWPQESFYTRSDHYNFARRGVPILFFFSGTHEDYHRPSDEADKIDAEKESRIVKLIFYLGLEIANAAARPKWNPDSYRLIVEGAAR
jgi:hypothetical protein